MFKLAKETTFWWRTEIQVPSGESKQTVTCELQFRVGVEDDAKDLESYVKGSLSEFDWIRKKIVGWRQVGDEEGNELPFNDENLARFLAIDYVRNSVSHGYLKAVNGAAPARKN